MWLLKLYLSSPVEAVIKGHVALPTETSKLREGCLASLPAIFNYILKRIATSENIATYDTNIRTFYERQLEGIRLCPTMDEDIKVRLRL